ncbi:aminotransferase class IV [Georgenia sp. SUBG003]|uniref:aminotransferase class IV n=1 Tax=Georgenia sp. SUBG003 TaxID=1497974 RepID=UPI003AB7058B
MTCAPPTSSSTSSSPRPSARTSPRLPARVDLGGAGLPPGGPGRHGAAKTGGNYAASLLPQQEAYEKGFEQVCFLDAATGTHLEELGGMNVFVVDADGTVRTPSLTGTILEGGTRAAILQLLRDAGRTVREETIELAPLLEQIRSGDVVETFACGTAAVITPIGRRRWRRTGVRRVASGGVGART